MRRLLCVIIVGLLGFLVGTACTNISPPLSTPLSVQVTAQTTKDLDTMNFLVDAEGGVELKRQGWRDYVPITFGTLLQWGDLVRVHDASSATIACADLSVQPLKSGYFGGLPCPQATPILTREESPILNPRSGALLLYPVVLSPRATALLDPHPRLHWLSVTTGVVTYTVTVRGHGLNWQTQTQQTQITYPAESPSLQPGSDGYVLIVEANGHSSEEEGGVFRGFTLLDDEAVNQVRDYERRIAALDVSDAARRYLLAQMYASQGLRADAIFTLETLVQEAQSPAMWHALAEQYSTVGLYDRAVDAYATARDLAKQHNETLSQAQAELGLGQACWRLNHPINARSHTQQALALFQSLNDEVGIRQSETLLKELGTP